MSSIVQNTDTYRPLRKYEAHEMHELFTFMYENRVWGNDLSPDYIGSSGPGSYVEYNLEYIEFVKTFIKDYNIGLINDFGCGTDLIGPHIYQDTNVVYNGYDIYEPLVNLNNSHFTRYNTNYFVLDFYNDMHKITFSDLLILKDVLSYWDNECIKKLLNYLIDRRLCKYILITNCCYQDEDNLDTFLGNFRPLNSQMSPLKDFGAISLLKYKTKEVCLIDLSQFFLF
jgi:hypothetical protein